MTDLLARAVTALDAGHLPLALYLEWERDGAAAWAASRDPGAMLALLALTERRVAALATARLLAACRDLVTDARRYDAALRGVEAWARGERDDSGHVFGVFADHDAWLSLDEAVLAAAAGQIWNIVHMSNPVGYTNAIVSDVVALRGDWLRGDYRCLAGADVIRAVAPCPKLRP